MNPIDKQIQWFWESSIKTESWKDLDGNIVVAWNGVLLVYPDFLGNL